MENGTVGEIRLFGGNFAPYNWALCEGQLLPIRGNEVIFTIVGTTYGGDGSTNFALPDLKGQGPGGAIYVICMTGVYPRRD
jgi:microcystin-dependent protein